MVWSFLLEAGKESSVIEFHNMEIKKANSTLSFYYLSTFYIL